MLDREDKMQPGSADFPNFAEGFGFASREAISEAREFSKTHMMGFRQGHDTEVEWSDVCNAVERHCLQAMKILHHNANGRFDWLIPGHQGVNSKQARVVADWFGWGRGGGGQI